MVTSMTSTATTITLTWTQPSAEVVTDFTIRHTFEVNGCAGVGGFNMETLSESSLLIADSTYQYTRTRLEEDSTLTVRITATNSAGTSPEAVIQTSTTKASKIHVAS